MPKLECGMHSAHGRYRCDIDGLRGVAVACVVLYHAGIAALPGGFVGVDVFFVISGYLITTQLWAARQKPAGPLLLDFFARRARRILPALAVVVLATILLGKFVLLPYGEQQDLGKSGLATAVFASNIFFYWELKDYFSSAAGLQPLLHTWSLAVEEQFYLFWPLLVIVCVVSAQKVRWSAQQLFCGAIAVTSLASLALAIAWTNSDPGAAFFLLPARLWELGVGGAFAILLNNRGAAACPRYIAPAGLACVLAPVLLYTPDTPFPGLGAIAPVVGTALLIYVGAHHRTGLTYRLLASRPLTLTGEISYALYLWHWPLLAIARLIDPIGHNVGRDLALAAIAYLLAYVSTRYFEEPIRRRRFPLFASAKASLIAGVCLMSLAAVVSAALWAPARALYRADSAPPSLECLTSGNLDMDGPCVLARGNAGTVYLAGDSHANQWAPAVALWATAAGFTAIERTHTACPVPLARNANGTGDRGFLDDCATFGRAVLAEIIATRAARNVKAVVLVANWNDYLYSAGATSSIATALDGALTALEQAGIRVLVIGPTPVFAQPVPACVLRRGENACRLARTEHDAAIKLPNQMLGAVIARHADSVLWNPTSQFCDMQWCHPAQFGELMFRDRHHLSIHGARASVNDLSKYLTAITLPDVGSEHETAAAQSNESRLGR